jgi:hypothetical protein
VHFDRTRVLFSNFVSSRKRRFYPLTFKLCVVRCFWSRRPDSSTRYKRCVTAKAEAKVKVKVEALRWKCWWRLWWWCWPNSDGSGGCSGDGFSRDGGVGFVGTDGFGTAWLP